MRRDLVLGSFADIRRELFEDVIWTPLGGAPMTVDRAIAGIEPRSERIEMFGEKLRTATHMTNAARDAFPGLARGDLLDDGQAWRVIDFEPIGDGRVEIVIAVVKA